MTATTPIEKHPNELQGISLDAPNPNPDPVLQGSEPAAQVTGTGWKRMACYNATTGEFVGYLGSSGDWLDLMQDKPGAENVAWFSSGADLYLAKDGDPQNRYLGVGTNAYACWGLWSPTGWVNAVVYNTDHTISWKAYPQCKLYGPVGNGWVGWSDGSDNQNILRCEMVDPR